MPTCTCPYTCLHMCFCCRSQAIVHAHIYTHAHTHAGTSTHTCVHTQRHTHVHLHSPLQLLFGATTHMYTNRCMCTCRGTRTCTLGNFFVKTGAVSPLLVSVSLVISSPPPGDSRLNRVTRGQWESSKAMQVEVETCWYTKTCYSHTWNLRPPCEPTLTACGERPCGQVSC